MAVGSAGEDYQKTVEQARNQLEVFKAALTSLPETTYACVKFFIPESPESTDGAFLWLMSPVFEDGFCYAQPFELPKQFTWIKVGQWLKFAEADLLDWYLLTEAGELTGGFSLRYQRRKLAPDRRAAFDERIGVKTYC